VFGSLCGPTVAQMSVRLPEASTLKRYCGSSTGKASLTGCPRAAAFTEVLALREDYWPVVQELSGWVWYLPHAMNGMRGRHHRTSLMEGVFSR
jgi:hypothetical protein